MKRLKHENILHIFGANLNSNQMFMVCPLKSQGDVCTSLHNNPSALRRKLVRTFLSFVIQLFTFDTQVLRRELGVSISSRKFSNTRGY